MHSVLVTDFSFVLSLVYACKEAWGHLCTRYKVLPVWTRDESWKKVYIMSLKAPHENLFHNKVLLFPRHESCCVNKRCEALFTMKSLNSQTFQACIIVLSKTHFFKLKKRNDTCKKCHTDKSILILNGTISVFLYNNTFYW